MPDKRRRKSLTVFRPSISALTPIDEPADSATANMLKKKHPHHQQYPRNAPFAFSSSPLSGSPIDGSMEVPEPSPTSIRRLSSKASMDRLIPKSRPRSLQKSARPPSMFGSLRSLHSFPDDEEQHLLTRTTSTPASVSSISSLSDVATGSLLYSGEVQTSGGMFRKKSQYLVLTDTHLVRFKSQTRASEVFPSIPSSLGKASGIRHSRISSSGSLHELHTTSSSDSFSAIPLNQVVAVYKLDDGRPYFSVEVAHLDEETMQASVLSLQLHDPKDSELWLSSIQGAALKSRLTNPLPFSQYLVEYTARALEQERDYDPKQFHMFKVVQRATKSGARSSSDDLAKLSSTICILAIGVYKIHLIPLPKMSKTASNTSLSDMMGISHGVTTLTSLNVQTFDDAFTLTFRIPLRQPSTLYLASSCVNDLALWMRQAADYLRPEWLEQPFTWNVPQTLDDELLPVPTSDEDHQCFDRTLTAYCSAYDLDTSKIRYTVDYHCEDAPAFELLPPADKRVRYSALELLAVMRALRYNESFGCISFRNTSLDTLNGRYDRFGHDHVPWSTRSGESLNMPEQADFSLLVQEIQALALKSKRLRRMDFSHSISERGPKGVGTVQDPGCGICEALFPLCAKQYTNVDWIVLDGIELTEVDIDYLFAAAIDRSCHFRALDLGYCGLIERSMKIVLHALSHQGSTMESINLSGNPARLEPNWHDFLRSFGYLRKIQMSHITRTSAPEPLIPFDLLQLWKLEILVLDRTHLNSESVEAIAAYLMHPQSNTLRCLQMNQCQLIGSEAAILLRAMAEERPVPRELHLQICENRLEVGHRDLIRAIAHDCCPTQLTLQMLEYTEEANFRGLLNAFAKNTTIRYLDISKVSLPSDASEETCSSLKRFFEENKTVEYLDISGEKAHLEANSLGSGLNDALIGLKKNSMLKILRIEHQSLGLHGASTLASVLEKNEHLVEVHCENNDINLQAFTVLVNSLETNQSVQFLPLMHADRAWAQKKVDQEVESLRESNSMSFAAMASTKATMRKTLGRTISGQRPPRIPERTSTLPDDEFRAAVSSLSSNWDREVARLQKYLARNYNIANGLPLDGPALLGIDRPGTSDSLSQALKDLQFDKTPVAEHDRQLGAGFEVEVDDKDEGTVDDEAIDDGDGDEIDAVLEISQSLHDTAI